MVLKFLRLDSEYNLIWHLDTWAFEGLFKLYNL